MKLWIKPAMLLGIGCTAVALTACGSSGGSGGSGGTAVIGVAAPLSGEAAVFGKPVDLITRAVVREVNRLGGIKGTKLKVVSEDEKFNAEDGVRVVNDLVNGNGAQFIIGPTSGTFMATLGFAARNHVEIASPYSGMVEYERSGGNYTFRTAGPDSLDGISIAKALQAQGVNRIAIMRENTDSADSTSHWLQLFYTRGGGKIVDTVVFNAGQSSYLPEVRNAFQHNPQVVFLAASAESAVPILREWKRLGLGGRWSVISELTNDQFVSEVGQGILEGSYGQLPLGTGDSPAAAGMLQVLTRAYGAKEAKSLVGAPGAAQDYDAAVAAALAMVAGGKATGTAINENLHRIGNPPGVTVTSFAQGKRELEAGHDINYVGASGPVDFNAHGTSAPDYGVLQVRNGRFVLIRRFSAAQLMKEIGQGQ